MDGDDVIGLSSDQILDLFLDEIEAVDDYWGPTFRAVYESGMQKQFIDRLSRRITEHDEEIEKMCNQNYRGYISSVKDLIYVRKDSTLLKDEVAKCDVDLKESIGRAVVKGDALIKARKLQQNIVSTLDNLSACLPVLQTFLKLSKQMNDRRYHPALKTIKKLEMHSLPIIEGYRFSSLIKASIPRLRASIKQASMSELNDFLEKLRKFSNIIGENSMRYLAVEKFGYNSKQESGAGDEREHHNNDILQLDGSVAAQDVVDFSPLYRCLHINTVLGEKASFVEYYRKQRKDQSELILKAPDKMYQAIDSYCTYFHGIVGFFVCEHHVMCTTNGSLVSHAHLESTWNYVSSQLSLILRNNFSICTETDFMMSLKNVMLAFTRSLRIYGCDLDCLDLLMLHLREMYYALITQQWVGKFRHIFNTDNYHPIKIDSGSECSSIINSFFPLNDEYEKMSSIQGIREFPFSQMVPRVYGAMKEFVLCCYKYTEDFNLSPLNIDETVRKFTNDLLVQTLSECLLCLIEQANLNLLQLIQLHINLYHLANSNVHLENYISEVTGVLNKAIHTFRLSGDVMFLHMRRKTEDKIHIRLISKLDEFIQLANYDWTMAEACGISSPWIVDLLAFLKDIFRSFTNLPTPLAKKCCVSVCQYLARALMALILDDEVRTMSMGVIAQIDLDVVQCEHFAASEPVMGLEEGILLDCFVDIRQLLDLFISWEWPVFLADYGQKKGTSCSTRYGRVSSSMALCLLEKLKESDKKGEGVFSLITSKKERDKRKLVDTVYKQLKSLQLMDAQNASSASAEFNANIIGSVTP